MVCLYVGPEWCFRRGAGAGSSAGQTESGNCDPSAHGHAEEGADIPGLRTRTIRGACAEAQIAGE